MCVCGEIERGGCVYREIESVCVCREIERGCVYVDCREIEKERVCREMDREIERERRKRTRNG